MRKIFFILSVLCLTNVFGQGFLHRDGQRIVDGGGKNVLLRGLGLGGWMVQEGYMLKTQPFASPQHVIKQKIEDVIGKENTAEFYEAYLKNGITKRDIDSLAAWGFNSVRLPMHYNLYTPAIEDEKNGDITWLEKGFKMTDDVLKWCEAKNIYLILDLHAAPGGQGKDAAISDYDESKPSLWESDANQKKMIAFWKKIAERYKDHPWIGAYDIINEPNWNFTGTNKNGCDEKQNGPLKDLMVSVTKAIRDVDKNHLIFIEGNCWGNNYSGVFPLWDDNMGLSFHKYWNYNDTASVQQFLDYREMLNVPIWLGESGENSNVWFTDAIALVESHNIGWAFWPMKKIANTAGVTSVNITEDYKALLNYWKDGGEKQSIEAAKTTLMQIAENYKMENLSINKDVIDAMFRQVYTKQTLPYANHELPGKIIASAYDLGQHNYAYFDTDFINYHVATGKERTPWNTGHVMRNDGVDLQACSDKHTNGFSVTDIKDGEWLVFTVYVKKAGHYSVHARVASENSNGILHLETEANTRSKAVSVPNTGGLNSWKTIEMSNVNLQEGAQKIKVVFDKGDFNLNYLEIK